MQKILIIGFIFLATTFTAAQKLPSFNDYPAKVADKNSKQPKLVSRDARLFRTNLRNAAHEGVNFAGRFVLASWGCGTGCMEAAIIDARTGNVFFPPALQGIGAGFCELSEDAEPIVFTANSRLLVLNGFVGGVKRNSNTKCGVFYMEWTGTDFRQVKFVPKKVITN